MSRAERRAAWLDRHRSSPSRPVHGALPAGPAQPDIALHIGELALHGLPPLRRHDVADAVRAELTRLITNDGIPRRLRAPGRAAHLAGGTIMVAPGAGATMIARQVAGAILGRPGLGGGVR